MLIPDRPAIETNRNNSGMVGGNVRVGAGIRPARSPDDSPVVRTTGRHWFELVQRHGDVDGLGAIRRYEDGGGVGEVHRVPEPSLIV